MAIFRKVSHMQTKNFLFLFVFGSALGLGATSHADYKPIYECSRESWECEPSSFTPDGLTFLNYHMLAAGNKVASVELRLMKRKDAGWAPQTYVADLSPYSLDGIASVYLSNDAVRVVIAGTQRSSSGRETYKMYFGELDEAHSTVALRPYASSATTPFYVGSGVGKSGDLKTFLFAGRYDYACEESRCRYGYVLYSNESPDGSDVMKPITSGDGRNVDIIAGGQYFSVSSSKGYSIHKMLDGSRVAFVPVETLWKWDGSFYEQYLTKMTIVSGSAGQLSYLGVDGTIRAVDFKSGKITTGKKLVGIEKVNTDPETRFSFRGDYVIYVDSRNETSYFSMSTGKPIKLPNFKIPNPKELLSLSATGKHMIVRSSNERFLCDMATGDFTGLASEDSEDSFGFLNKYGDLHFRKLGRNSFATVIYGLLK